MLVRKLLVVCPLLLVPSNLGKSDQRGRVISHPVCCGSEQGVHAKKWPQGRVSDGSALFVVVVATLFVYTRHDKSPADVQRLLSLGVDMYICIYMHVCMCIYICMHLYTCVCVCVCIFVHRLWVSVSVLQRVDSVMHAHVCSCAYVFVFICV